MRRAALLLACLFAVAGCSDVPPSSESCPGTGFRNCRGIDVPQVEDGFVPQGLEIDGDRAFVGGYDGTEPVGRRWCQLAVVDLRTGDIARFVDHLGETARRSKATSCRHGGGLELTRDGLWIAGYDRLWLLDPDRLTVRRVWSLGRGVRGSTLVLRPHRIGIGGFEPARSSRIWWFDRGRVLERGRTVLPPASLTLRAPAGLQGLTSRDRYPWFVTSTSRCGTLRMPGRDPVRFVPGAEDLELRGGSVWTVSEAGSLNYRGRGPRVPSLLRLNLAEVRDAGPSSCRV